MYFMQVLEFDVVHTILYYILYHLNEICIVMYRYFYIMIELSRNMHVNVIEIEESF